MDKNPFFGRWSQLSSLPSSLESYDKIINCVSGQIFEREYIKTPYMISVSPTFTSYGVQYPIDTVPLPQNTNIIYADFSMHRPFLIFIDKALPLTTNAIGAAVYKALAAGHAPAIRPVNDTDRQVHWVWFRKSPTYRLTEEILLRAASWIKFNPGFTFHLWTNVKDAAELDDFLSGIDPAVRSFYCPRITFHYHDEFYTTIQKWILAWTPELSELFHEVWNSSKYQDIVMKTDYTRNILLASQGGIYADFNDLLCLCPIEPLLECHAGNYIGVADVSTLDYASNYFMYAAHGNAAWNEIVIRCTRTMPHINAFMNDKVVFQSIQAYIQGNVNNLKSVRRYSSKATDQAIQSTLLATLHECLPTVFTEAILNSFNRTKLFPTQLLAEYRNQILEAPALQDTWFKHYAYLYLHYIMYSTNLPIFCREQKIPLYLLPYSYLLRYSCFLSFIGHLGDGTSLGGTPAQRIRIRDLCA